MPTMTGNHNQATRRKNLSAISQQQTKCARQAVNEAGDANLSTALAKGFGFAPSAQTARVAGSSRMMRDSRQVC
jgi:hypothetical protein